MPFAHPSLRRYSHPATRYLRIASRIPSRCDHGDPDRPSALPERPAARGGLDWSDAGTLPTPVTPSMREAIRQLARSESVVNTDDLLYRRTDWGIIPEQADRLRPTIAALLSGEQTVTGTIKGGVVR